MQASKLSLLVGAALLGAVASACSDDGHDPVTDSVAQPVTNAAAAPVEGLALDQLKALAAEKRSRTPSQRKLSSQLLLAAKARRGDPQVSSLGPVTDNVKLGPAGTVLVDIKAKVDAKLLSRIRALGANITSSVPRFDAIQAHVPLDQLELLADEPGVRWIMPALGWVTNKVNTSEGDVAHKAATTRATSGLTGAGVTVGVISDGVDTLAQRQASGDLPAVTVLPGRAGSGDEGTAMLEIVHDLAPGATLLFSTALPTAADFAQNILDLRAAGADIIVDDIAYLGEAAFQDDVIAQAVDIVTADGALFFSAAGNDGNVNDGTASSYEGDYTPLDPPPAPIDDEEWMDAHEFDGLHYNLITFDPPSVITLQWSDPYGGSNNDYDLFLLNAARTMVVLASTGSQSGSEPPLELIDSSVLNHANRALMVARWSGEPRMLRLSTHRGSLQKQTNGQIWGHAAATNAFGMAAVDIATASGGPFVGGATNPAEWFSSDGPRRIFFEADGTPITPGNFLSSGGLLRQKPEFAAADGVTTATPGFEDFHGTSAAAPHTAALAALMLEARPDIAAMGNAGATAAARDLMLQSALDIEAVGFDRDSGAGIVMADILLVPCKIGATECDDGNPCTQTDTCEAGECVGSNPIVCPAPAQCQQAGSCNPDSGECEYPDAVDGTDCDDDNECTQSDSCQGGICEGSNPITCPAPGECHVQGTCDPATGLCSNPVADDGTGCDDGNACTLSDSCQGGVCTAGTPVICEASDDCHLPGTCDPATGECSNPKADDGTACDDGDACTLSDTCQSGICTGENPVICEASDQCHLAGTCNPETGECSNPQKDGGSTCDDGDACTQIDSCQDGECAGADPVDCSAPDGCHLAGTCNPETGACNNPEAPEGTPCSGGECTGGACVPVGVGGAGGGMGDGGSDSTGDGGSDSMNEGGAESTAGSPAQGGNVTAGAAGATSSGGNTATAGSTSAGSTSAGSTSAGSSGDGETPDQTSSCSCRAPGRARSQSSALFAGLALVLVTTRRRARPAVRGSDRRP